MKTRKVLMAMVLPALFAACTSEDFVETTPSLNGRALLGDGFTVEVSDNNASTRFAWENHSWKFEAGDEFGAAVTDPTKFGTVVNTHMLGNYIFSKGTNGAYTTTSQMYEGTYLFYSYKGFQNKSTRDLIEFNLGLQEADLNKPEETINNSDAKLFFSPLYKVEAKKVGVALPLEFYPYWSVAAVSIKNMTKKPLTISQIVLKDEANNFVTKGQIDPAKLVSKLMYTMSEDGKYVLPKDVKFDEEMAKVDLVKAGSETKTGSIVLKCNDYELAANKEVVAYINVPAGTHSKLTVEVIAMNDDDEMVSFTEDADEITFKHGATKAIFGLESDNKTLTSMVIDGKGYAVSEVYIDNKADLVSAIKQARTGITVSNLGELAIDADVATALEKAKGVVTFKNPIAIKIVTKAAGSTIKNANFAGGVTVESGEVTFDADVTLGEKKAMTVKGGKVILKNGTYNSTGSQIIVNGGEVELAGDDMAIAGIDVKNGTLTVSKDQTVGTGKIATLSFGNGDKDANALKVVASTTEDGIVVPTTLTISEAEVILTTKTTATIDETSTITLTNNAASELTNNGSIENSGTITVAGNSAALTNGTTGSIVTDGKVEGVANNGYIELTDAWKSDVTITSGATTGLVNNTVDGILDVTGDNIVYHVYTGKVESVTNNAGELAVFYNATLAKAIDLSTTNANNAFLLGTNNIDADLTMDNAKTLQIGLKDKDDAYLKLAGIVTGKTLVGADDDKTTENVEALNKTVATYVNKGVTVGEPILKNYGGTSGNRGIITYKEGDGFREGTWSPEGSITGSEVEG